MDIDELEKTSNKLVSKDSVFWEDESNWFIPDSKNDAAKWYKNINVYQSKKSYQNIVVEKFTQKAGEYLPQHSHPKTPVFLYLLKGSISLKLISFNEVEKIINIEPHQSAIIPIEYGHAVYATTDSACVSIHYENGGLTVKEPLDNKILPKYAYEDIRNSFILGNLVEVADIAVSHVKNIKELKKAIIISFSENGEIEKADEIKLQQSLNLEQYKTDKFLSYIIHNNPIWSPKKVYFFTKNDLNISYVENWYEVRLINELPNETQEHLLGDFDDSDNNIICVYCPFIVPNDKPLANYVGLYSNIQSHKFSELLEQIAAMQHAGTLYFQNFAIKQAIASKFEKIKKPLEDLRNLRQSFDKASLAINEIESTLNPYYLSIGDKQIDALRSNLSKFFQDTHDIYGKTNSWESMDANNRTDMICKIEKEINDELVKIESVLNNINNHIYKEYFDFDFINRERQYSTLFKLKAIAKNYLTLSWLKKSIDYPTIDSDEKIKIDLDNDGKPFPFCRALKLLNSDKFTSITFLLDDRRLTASITIEIQSDERRKLENLQSIVENKITTGGSFNLSDGQTATAIAIIATSASCLRDININKDCEKIVIVTEYAYGKFK